MFRPYWNLKMSISSTTYCWLPLQLLLFVCFCDRFSLSDTTQFLFSTVVIDLYCLRSLLCQYLNLFSYFYTFLTLKILVFDFNSILPVFPDLCDHATTWWTLYLNLLFCLLICGCSNRLNCHETCANGWQKFSSFFTTFLSNLVQIMVPVIAHVRDW